MRGIAMNERMDETELQGEAAADAEAETAWIRWPAWLG